MEKHTLIFYRAALIVTAARLQTPQAPPSFAQCRQYCNSCRRCTDRSRCRLRNSCLIQSLRAGQTLARQAKASSMTYLPAHEWNCSNGRPRNSQKQGISNRRNMFAKRSRRIRSVIAVCKLISAILGPNLSISHTSIHLHFRFPSASFLTCRKSSPELMIRMPHCAS
jgi:hypothetical protein